MFDNKNENIEVKPQLAVVADSGGSTVNTQGGIPYLNANVAAPYGITSVPPKSTLAVTLPLGGGAVCLGAIVENGSLLQPGEIMLRSQGGAEIILKNNGKVYINGKEV